MENPTLLAALKKLVEAGEQAGIGVEQMIRILEAGFSVEDVLRLIAERLEEMPAPQELPRAASPPASARWIM